MSNPITKHPRIGDSAITVDDAIPASSITTAMLAANNVTGAKLSSTSRNKPLHTTIPTVGTTGTTECLLVVPYAGTITGANVAFKDALTRDASNFLTFAIKNKGQAGAGTTDVLSTADTNTTKTSTGRAIAAYTTLGLAINGTPANLVVAAGDVLAIQCISAATLANALTEGCIVLGLDVPA